MELARLDVEEDSCGYFVALFAGKDSPKRVSLYYDSKDLAQSDLETGTWIQRLNRRKDTVNEHRKYS